MKPLKVSNALASEYIAQGSRGKHTLINIYTGNILVREFPANIPMAFYVEISPEFNHKAVIKIQVLVDNDMRAELEVEFPESTGGDSGLIVIPQLPILFRQGGEIKVTATGDDIRKTVLLRKTISLGPVPA